MRVFVAGASGVIGRRLVPRLVERGHQVVATTRRPEKSDGLRGARGDGGGDGRPRRGLGRRGRGAGRAGGRRPPDDGARRRSATCAGSTRSSRATNELRTRGHRLPARRVRRGRRPPLRRPELHGLAERARRRAGEDGGRPARSGSARPPARGRSRRSATSSGRSSRPRRSRGSRSATAASTARARRWRTSTRSSIRARKLPLVGDGAGVWSFVHVDDAAAATVARRRARRPGVYNVVDDDPAPVAEWLPVPRRVPRRPAASPRAGVARPVRDRRGRRLDDDPGPRLVEREGEARARLASPRGRAGATGSPRGLARRPLIRAAA